MFRSRARRGAVRWGRLIAVLLLASCGDTSIIADSTTTVAPSITTAPTTTTSIEPGLEGPDSPCDIGDVERVRSAFRGTVSDGTEFPGASCRYGIENGAALWVDVQYLGAGDEWEEIKSRYSTRFGGIEETAGVGEEAFHPADHGVRDLIFLTNGQVYAVIGHGGPTDEMLTELGDSVRALAISIVADTS